MKVLIVEQHSKPGGYCTSFRRKGFTFDAAAHSFGGLRDSGYVKKVFTDLQLTEAIQIHRFTPSDIMIYRNHAVYIDTDISNTVKNLSNLFPSESKAIQEFFDFFISGKQHNFVQLRKKTFAQFLDSFFQNHLLKRIIATPVFGNGGLPPSLISAFTGAKIWSEFILDGGYYPAGGMQAIPDALCRIIERHGGKVMLNSRANSILIEKGRVRGVTLTKGQQYTAKYVVSACDIKQTYENMLSGVDIAPSLKYKLSSFLPSLSTFVLYIGLDTGTKMPFPFGTNIWVVPGEALETVYQNIKHGMYSHNTLFMVRLSPDRRTLLSFINAPFQPHDP